MAESASQQIIRKIHADTYRNLSLGVLMAEKYDTRTTLFHPYLVGIKIIFPVLNNMIVCDF